MLRSLFFKKTICSTNTWGPWGKYEEQKCRSEIPYKERCIVIQIGCFCAKFTWSLLSVLTLSVSRRGLIPRRAVATFLYGIILSHMRKFNLGCYFYFFGSLLISIRESKFSEFKLKLLWKAGSGVIESILRTNNYLNPQIQLSWTFSDFS